MRYFLGVDVGSSKTHALIADETGCCVGFGKSGGGNHQGVGYGRLAEVLKDAFERAQQISGVGPGQIAGAAFGIAGFDFPSEKEDHLKTLTGLGLSCPLDVFNDGWNGLISGTSHGFGVNVAAGSGINCRGRSASGKEGRVVGNGVTFGEHGGSIEIVHRALQLVNHAWIKRIEPTILTKIFLEATGATDEENLMEGLSDNRYRLFPRLTIEIVKAARAGDHAAMDAIRWSGEELGWLAVAVARQIEMQNDDVEIVQSGSVFEAGDIIMDPMKEVVLQHCPKAKLIRLVGAPVIGPLMFGMQLTGIDPYPMRAKIIETAKEIMK
jgi:N-acetylglucosamine kinase-like BadF-type ATPase